MNDRWSIATWVNGHHSLISLPWDTGLTDQALIDREGTLYYYLPLTPRVWVSIPTAISGPVLYVDPKDKPRDHN